MTVCTQRKLKNEFKNYREARKAMKKISSYGTLFDAAGRLGFADSAGNETNCR